MIVTMVGKKRKKLVVPTIGDQSNLITNASYQVRPSEYVGSNLSRNTSSGADNPFLDGTNECWQLMVIIFISCRRIRKQFMNREIQKPRPSSLVQLSTRNNTEKYQRILKYTTWGAELANYRLWC